MGNEAMARFEKAGLRVARPTCYHCGDPGVAIGIQKYRCSVLDQ